MAERNRTLGLAACTAIVVGNMVGASFFLSPALLAPYGSLAVLAWMIMAIGAICQGLTFAKLARLAPVTGGPYAYTRLAYGNFAGFLIAWGYWTSMWTSLPVIALAFSGAVTDLFPALKSRGGVLVLTLSAIWLICLINLRGVRSAGRFAEITTYSKLIPFLAIAVFGVFFIDRSNYATFDPGATSYASAFAAMAPVTMFAFLGLESATVPAGDVRDPARTIPRSTILGIAIAAGLYVLGTVVVLGVVPEPQLVKSAAPFSDAARLMWGHWASLGVTAAVIISAIGALNGWTLLMGQVPMAAAEDGLFPAFLANRNRHDVPWLAIIVSAALSTLLVLLQSMGSPQFAAVYSAMLGLSTMTAIIPYALCALAPGLVAARAGKTRSIAPLTIVEIVAFGFAVFTLYGCGASSVLSGAILLVLGVPVYVWQQRRLANQRPHEAPGLAGPDAPTA